MSFAYFVRTRRCSYWGNDLMIFDRGVWLNRESDHVDLYQKLMSHAIGLFLPIQNPGVSSGPDIQIVVENRFKNKRQKDALITMIAEHTGIAVENIRSQ